MHQAKKKCTVQAIMSYAMYCFSSSFLFSSLATFLAVSGKVGMLCIFVFWSSPMLFVVIGGFVPSSMSESMYISCSLHLKVPLMSFGMEGNVLLLHPTKKLNIQRADVSGKNVNCVLP
jgi:hypothetical protein